MPNIFPVERVARRSPTDRLRMHFYLVRVDWYLEGATRSSERKAAIRSLREELEGDPRDIRAALKDLGPPNALAARYAEEGQRSPMWSIGIIIAAIALLIYWTVFLSFASGMLAVVHSTAPGEAHASFLFIDVVAFSNATGIGIGWSGGWTWLGVPAAIVTIAFLLGARSWRLATPASPPPQ
jgi:hypothetical protein